MSSVVLGIVIVALLVVAGLWIYGQSRDDWTRNPDGDPWWDD